MLISHDFMVSYPSFLGVLAICSFGLMSKYCESVNRCKRFFWSADHVFLLDKQSASRGGHGCATLWGGDYSHLYVLWRHCLMGAGGQLAGTLQCLFPHSPRPVLVTNKSYFC